MRWTCWIAALVALVYLCNYLVDARLRMTKAPGCKWNTVPNSTKPSYSARFCYLTKDRALLRLDDAAGLHLLAERDFFEMDYPHFYWEADALVYNDRNYDGGEIALPPTLIDRLRANLP